MSKLEVKPYGFVLGTRLDVTTYALASEQLIARALSGTVTAVAAANTHLVAEANSDPAFAAVLQGFDLVVPDGMPLVWALQLDGHDISERVYGPYLMEYLLRHAPANSRHFFFGGTQGCLDLLRQRVTEINSRLVVVGAVSPPFGAWSADVEANLIAAINAAEPDFVWVALGGVRQETWIAANRHRFKCGVFLAVGDAFALVAGMRAYAPAWIQRCGLTWLYRLVQEPQRLLGRYARYNTRFVIAFLRERMGV